MKHLDAILFGVLFAIIFIAAPLVGNCTINRSAGQPIDQTTGCIVDDEVHRTINADDYLTIKVKVDYYLDVISELDGAEENLYIVDDYE